MSDRVYSNHGNLPLIDLIGKGCNRLLDVGCGAGDNAGVVRSNYPECKLFGITHSPTEAAIAATHLKHCWVFDVESELPADLARQSFDVLIFSHVLEHLRDPAVVLARFSRLLRTGGKAIVAVPNVLFWRMRFEFLRGNFVYGPSGALDDTHLRFFTYLTADRYLMAQSDCLRLASKSVSGSMPLWWFRRWILSPGMREMIDRWGCRHWPNLFGDQVLLVAVKQ
jgi:SAM-dependent methyltransferase